MRTRCNGFKHEKFFVKQNINLSYTVVPGPANNFQDLCISALRNSSLPETTWRPGKEERIKPPLCACASRDRSESQFIFNPARSAAPPIQTVYIYSSGYNQLLFHIAIKCYLHYRSRYTTAPGTLVFFLGLGLTVNEINKKIVPKQEN